MHAESPSCSCVLRLPLTMVSAGPSTPRASGGGSSSGSRSALLSPLKSHGRRQRGRDSNGKERSKVNYQKVSVLKQCKVWQSVGSARCVAECGVLWRPMSYRRVDYCSKVLCTSCFCVDRLLLVGFPFAPCYHRAARGLRWEVQQCMWQRSEQQR